MSPKSRLSQPLNLILHVIIPDNLRLKPVPASRLRTLPFASRCGCTGTSASIATGDHCFRSRSSGRSGLRSSRSARAKPPAKGIVGNPRVCRIEGGLEAICVRSLELGLMDGEVDRRPDDFWSEREAIWETRHDRPLIGAVGKRQGPARRLLARKFPSVRSAFDPQNARATTSSVRGSCFRTDPTFCRSSGPQG